MRNGGEKGQGVAPVQPPDKKAKLYSALAYIPLVWIVSFFAQRKNMFVRFHIKQGMKLTLFAFVTSCVAWALNVLFSRLFSYSVATPTAEDAAHVTTGVNQTGQTVCLAVIFCAVILCLLYFLYGVIAASTGKTKPLPFLGTPKVEKKPSGTETPPKKNL